MEINRCVRDADGYFSVYALAECFVGRIVTIGDGVCEARRIDEIVIDSRKAKECALFVALVGDREDGERFVSDAFDRGAAVALCRNGGADRIGASGVYIEVDDPLASLVRAAMTVRKDSDLLVVGITGSVGKTTVKELCIKVLSQRYPADGTNGNYNNLLGLSLSILNAFGVGKIGEIRGKFQEKRQKCLILEMGISHRDEMEELARIARPDIAIVTNVGKMHAEHLGGREGCAEEKCKIASCGAEKVICPCDGTVLRQVLRYVERSRIMTISASGYTACEPCVTDAVIERGRMDGEFSLIVRELSGYNREYGRFTAPIVGEHGVWNSAIASALGWAVGLSGDEVSRGFSDFQPPSMRQEIRTDGGIVRIVDCYNSGPESARAALSVLFEYARKNGCYRRIAVLGDMLELGEISEKEHFMLGGALATYGVDLLFTVGERSERIADGAIDCGFSEDCVVRFGATATYEAAKERIESCLRAGDIILYKASRGMGLEKLIPMKADGGQ